MTQGEKEVILSWFTDIMNLVKDANEKKFTFQDNQDCLSEIMTRCLDSKQYIEEHCKPFPVELGDWQLNTIWQPVSNPPTEDKNIIIGNINDNTVCVGAYYSNGEYYSHMNKIPVADGDIWAYLEDLMPKTKETKNSITYGCLDWQTECVREMLELLGEAKTHSHLCDVGDILQRYVKENC